MKLAFVSAELSPYAKVGGLADVAYSLPKALKKLNIDLKIFLPAYLSIKNRYNLTVVEKNIEIVSGNEKKSFSILKDTINDSLEVIFIESKEYFDRENVYGYNNDGKRFAFFCKSVLEALRTINFNADVIHTNDWQTAFIPVYLKTIYKNADFFTNTKTVFTIHNLAYQGMFPKQFLEEFDIPESEFQIEGIEFYGEINLMKAGIIYSYKITTVSEQYSKEIQTEEFGERLDGLLRSRNFKLSGIINGIDLDEFNPLTDKRIPQNFNIENITGKKICKEVLRKELKLNKPDKDTPIFGIISRLVSQKGLDILISVLSNMKKLNIQIVILGTGDNIYHDILKKESKKQKGNLSLNLKFDATLAQKIYAGSDFFLMPSKYEPCGLGQMIALRYGTIPIVHNTGGLKDTIIEFDPKTLTGNGFGFDNYSSEDLLKTIKKAITIYNKKKIWDKLIINAINSDFSWKISALKYKELYRSLIV